LVQVVASEPNLRLWPKVLESYKRSGSYRGSENNFHQLITPFAGMLEAEHIKELFEAILANDQNYYAGATSSLLLLLLRSQPKKTLPPFDDRDKFFNGLAKAGQYSRFEDSLALLQSDGWTFKRSTLKE